MFKNEVVLRQKLEAGKAREGGGTEGQGKLHSKENINSETANKIAGLEIMIREQESKLKVIGKDIYAAKEWAKSPEAKELQANLKKLKSKTNKKAIAIKKSVADLNSSLAELDGTCRRVSDIERALIGTASGIAHAKQFSYLWELQKFLRSMVAYWHTWDRHEQITSSKRLRA